MCLLLTDVIKNRERNFSAVTETSHFVSKFLLPQIPNISNYCKTTGAYEMVSSWIPYKASSRFKEALAKVFFGGSLPLLVGPPRLTSLWQQHANQCHAFKFPRVPHNDAKAGNQTGG